MEKYSQVIYLNEKLIQKVILIQKKLFRITGSRACLDLWKPHITIGDGLWLDKDSEEKYCEKIASVVQNFSPFYVGAKNYTFEDDWNSGDLGYSPFAISLGVVVNNKLNNLAEAVKNKITVNFSSFYRQPLPYMPHITVAFKDLNKEDYEKAKELLKNETFDDKTIIDHVSISKENAEGLWIEYKRFRF